MQYPEPTKGNRRFAAVSECTMFVLSLRLSFFDIKSQSCELDWDKNNHQEKWRSFCTNFPMQWQEQRFSSLEKGMMGCTMRLSKTCDNLISQDNGVMSNLCSHLAMALHVLL